MMKRLASDLSPVQSLISQISCQSCQDFAIETHFRQALIVIKSQINLDSWQNKRLLALLSPMYLEVKNRSLSIEDESTNIRAVSRNELLLEYKLSHLKKYSACSHRAALQAEDESFSIALVELKKIFNEVLGKDIF